MTTKQEFSFPLILRSQIRPVRHIQGMSFHAVQLSSYKLSRWSRIVPRPLSIALLALFCLAFTARAEEKPSPAVKRILDKAVGEVKKNRERFTKANEKPLNEARGQLQELSTKLIKDGKADEATAVLAQVKTLESDVMKMANAPEHLPGGGGRPLSQKPLLERLEGKWRRAKDEVVIQRDGVIWQSNGDQAQIRLVSPEIAEVQWASGWKWHCRMVDDEMAVAMEWDPKGKRSEGIVLTRIK